MVGVCILRVISIDFDSSIVYEFLGFYNNNGSMFRGLGFVGDFH